MNEMAIATINGHVNRALQFYSLLPEMYFVVGNPTAGSWTDDFKPTSPSATDKVDVVVGYKKVGTAYPVVKDATNGTISFNGTKWRLVTPDNAYTEGARWIYVTASIDYSELPVGVSYRQIGITTGLQKVDGVTTDALLPTQVKDPGILQTLDNRTPIYREASQREQIIQVIEF